MLLAQALLVSLVLGAFSPPTNERERRGPQGGPLVRPVPLRAGIPEQESPPAAEIADAMLRKVQSQYPEPALPPSVDNPKRATRHSAPVRGTTPISEDARHSAPVRGTTPEDAAGFRSHDDMYTPLLTGTGSPQHQQSTFLPETVGGVQVQEGVV